MDSSRAVQKASSFPPVQATAHFEPPDPAQVIPPIFGTGNGGGGSFEGTSDFSGEGLGGSPRGLGIYPWESSQEQGMPEVSVQEELEREDQSLEDQENQEDLEHPLDLQWKGFSLLPCLVGRKGQRWTKMGRASVFLGRWWKKEEAGSASGSQWKRLGESQRMSKSELGLMTFKGSQAVR